MNLKSIKQEQSAVVDIVSPTGEPTDILITVAGIDSEVYRVASQAKAKVAIARMTKGGRRSKQIDDEDLEKAEAENIGFLVACTLGWTGIEEDGAVLPFSPATARRLYTDHRWLREQVDAAIVDRSLFFKTSPEASSPSESTSSGSAPK